MLNTERNDNKNQQKKKNCSTEEDHWRNDENKLNRIWVSKTVRKKKMEREREREKKKQRIKIMNNEFPLWWL